MKKILFILSSAALVFTACQKEESTVAEAGDFELTATIEQQVDGTDTKTSLSSGNILWTAGDAIMVFDASGNRDKLEAQSGGGTSTSFKEPTTKVKDDGFSNTGDHYAIYPYADGVSCTSSGTITFTLPATQTYAEGTFGQDANVAVASIGTSGTSFYNVCGVLKLQLTGSATVTSIELSGTSNEVIYGKYTVDATSSDPTTTYVSDGGTTITLNCGGGVALSTSPTFYFVVPVGAFANGFIAQVHTSDSKTYIVSSTKTTNTISRSKVRAMPSTGFQYQKVQYLQSSGTQYINTGTKLTQNSNTEIVFEYKTMPGNVFGSRTSATENNIGIAGSSGVAFYIDFYDYTTSRATIEKLTLDYAYKAVTNKNSRILTAYSDGTTIATNNREITNEFSTPDNVLLFDCANPYQNTKLNGKIYYCKLSDGNPQSLIRNFIPAICKSGASYTDGNTGSTVTASADKPGMFDLVTGKFFVNQGSGAFTTDLDVE